MNDGLTARYVRGRWRSTPNGDIFAGADFVGGAGGVFRSTDNGETWVDISGGVITTDVRALAIDASGTIFAGTYPGSGVFRSEDNGESWEPVNSGLECGNVWSLAINAAGHIFAGTAGCEDGVYRSTDGGENWVLANTGLTSTDIAALDVAPRTATSSPARIRCSARAAACSGRPTTARPGLSRTTASARTTSTT